MKKPRNYKKKSFSPVQKIVLFMIMILFVLVIGYLIFGLTYTSENITKSKIETLASDYYENYLYKQIVDSKEDPAKILDEYKKIGLSIVYLRQLLRYENDKELENYLLKHCDENKTSVKFYPESPYTKTSYHTDYSYSCDF